MARKVIIGMLAVFVVVAIASAGYKVGRYLAQSKTDTTSQASKGAG